MKVKCNMYCALASVFAGLVLSSCTPAVSAKISGDWQLVFFEIDKTAQEIAPATLRVQIESNSTIALAGFSGVNSFSGTSGIRGNTLSVNPAFRTTRMAGPQRAMEFETNFLKSLSQADSIRAEEAEGSTLLTIASTELKSVLRFRPLKLQGTRWNVTALKMNGSIVSLDEGTENRPYLSFGTDGTISGSTGVNRIHLPYQTETENRSLTIGDGAATLMATGDEKAAEIETAFLQLLPEITSYSFFGNTLTLSAADDTIVMQLRRQELVI